MTQNRDRQFEVKLEGFPQKAQTILRRIPVSGGRLSADECDFLCEHLGIGPEDLMHRLLPLAQAFSVAPISHFQVGAVVMARVPDSPDRFELFLGANIEFINLPLNQTIHAEQSAILNAWHQGAGQLYNLAVTASPCGYCRQFLCEIETDPGFKIRFPSLDKKTWHQETLDELLPHRMGPADLGNQPGLMAPNVSGQKLALYTDGKDPVLEAALSAAEHAYAPYSRNYAGCALETKNGEILTGRCVESAAYSPSLTALHSAILRLNLSPAPAPADLRRAVLVEIPTLASQRRATELLLSAWAPQIALEYYRASLSSIASFCADLPNQRPR